MASTTNSDLKQANYYNKKYPDLVGVKYGFSQDIPVQMKYGPIQDVPLQEKYGVPIDPLEEKYGVPIDPLEEKYGVPIEAPYPTQFKYGPIQDINITYSQLEDNIAQLKKTINNLKSSWNDQTKSNLNKLNNSWVGADCTAYTNKLMSMDGKVQKTIESLELLCSTYESARDMVKENQSQVLSSINSSI